MSTKIYEAWRVPLAQLNAWLDETDRLTRERFFAVSDFLLRAAPWQECVQQARAKAARWRTKFDGRLVRGEAVEWLIGMYKKDALQLERTPFSVGAGLNVWLDGDWAYIMPIGDHVVCAPAEDFSYWDNTDAPDDVDEDEFEERGKTWHRLLGPNQDTHNAHRLYHQIIDFGPGMTSSSLHLELHTGGYIGMGGNQHWRITKRGAGWPRG